MPVAVHITPHTMSKDDYEQMCGRLEAEGVQPDGRIYHAS